MRVIRLTALFLSVILSATAAAHGQYEAGAVLGTVSDASGAVVRGAKIALKSSATGLTVERTSNQSGEYEFTGVLPGDYGLTTEAAGFVKQTTTFSVVVGARQRVDMKMQLGAAETVTVT